MRCSLCETNCNPDNMTELENGDIICQACNQGLEFEEMKVKPIKKNKNESIPNNFRSSVRKLFNIDKDKKD